MATIKYGTVNLPINDPESIDFFKGQVLAILAKGGGWLALADPDEGKAHHLLITPGVALSIESDESPEELAATASYVASVGD